MLLTIGIPTYRSHETLFRTLESIRLQSLKIDWDLTEILIVDNDPDSKLSDLLEASTYPKFLEWRYIRNSSNIGYDGNIQKIAQLANGKYVKYLADDDCLAENFLTQHLILLETLSPDIVVNEFETYRGSNYPLSDLSSKSVIETLSPIWSFDKMKLLNGRYGQISALTFRTELISKLHQPVRSNYIHLFWFYSMIEKSKVAYERIPHIYVQLGSPNFSSSVMQIVETSLTGLNAIKSADVKNRKLYAAILDDAVNYAFQVFRLFPELKISRRFQILLRHRRDLLIKPYLFLRYLPYVVIPSWMKQMIKKWRS